MVVMVSGGTEGNGSSSSPSGEWSGTVDPDCSSSIVNGERLEYRKGRAFFGEPVFWRSAGGGGRACVRAGECFSGSLKAGIPRFPAPRVNVWKPSHADRCNDLNRA